MYIVTFCVTVQEHLHLVISTRHCNNNLFNSCGYLSLFFNKPGAVETPLLYVVVTACTLRAILYTVNKHNNHN